MTNQRLKKLTNFYRQHNYIPSYDALLGLFKLKSKGSLHRYLKKFIEEGYLVKNENGSLVATSKLYGPRVLGTVQAGFPSPAEEELADTMDLDNYLIKNPNASYLLKVSGDSMIDAGIQEGDLVIVDRSLNPQNGDVVIAEVDDEWTMKYFIKTGNKIILRAANKKYKDIHPQTVLRIAGVVASVIRKYK